MDLRKKTKAFVLRVLNIKQEELYKFALLFFHSFSLGLFVAFYFVAANSEFISHFGSNYLPLAYIISGVVGYGASLLYSYLQQRIDTRWLFLGTLIFLFVIPLIALILLWAINNEFVTMIGRKQLSFFVFIWAWPFISLTGILSGGLAIRYLNLRQVKRQFGFISAGGISAAILGYLIIPILVNFWRENYNLLYVALGGVLLSIWLLYYLYKQPTEDKPSGKAAENEIITFRDLLKERYFVFIFLSALISMTVVYITDFGFLATVKSFQTTITTAQGSVNVIQILGITFEVSGFISIVYAVLKVGELIMSLLSSRVLSQYGVKLGLRVLPFSLTVLITIAMFVGFGVGVGSIAFLALIVLNKSVERILRKSLDEPSFNILYQPLPGNLQLAVQAKVGVVMQISIAVAGLILLLFSFVMRRGGGFDLSYYALLFLPLLLGWSFVATKLYNSYKAKLRQVLTEVSKSQKSERMRNRYGDEVLKTKFKAADENVVRMSVRLAAETEPAQLIPYASSLLKNGTPEVRKVLLACIDPLWNQRLKDAVEKISVKEDSEVIRNIANKAKHYLDYKGINEPLAYNEALKLLESEKSDDHIKLIKYLNEEKVEKDIDLINKLLDDSDKTVRACAVKLATQRNNPRLNSRLVELFERQEFRNLCASAFLEISPDTLTELERYFQTSKDIGLLLKIVEVYAKVGTATAKSLLVQHLMYPNRDVQQAIVRALTFCRYQASPNEMPIIKDYLQQVVENILWAYVAIDDLESNRNTLKLIQSIELERDNNFEIMFNLLSFAYKPTTIEQIRKNIIGENTIFAFEIIENFISQDIKQLIIPLLDNISVTQRIKKLSSFVKMPKMKLVDRLKDIILRDYNKVDIWTKSKAIELLGKLYKTKDGAQTHDENEEFMEIELWTRERVLHTLNIIAKSDIPDEIFVCMHHPEELIYSTAARIVYEENPIRCTNYLKRLSVRKHGLIEMLEDEEKAKQLLSERVKYVKRHPWFFSVPEYTLIKLAQIVTTHTLKKGESVSLVDSQGNELAIILIKGLLSFTDAEGKETTFNKDEVIIRGDNVPFDCEGVVAKKETTLLTSPKHDYFNMLVDEPAIIQHMFDIVDET